MASHLTITTNDLLESMNETLNILIRTATSNMSSDQVRAVSTQIGLLSRVIESIRVESAPWVSPLMPFYQLDDNDEKVPPEEQLMVEDECPICMEEYIVTRKSVCGHHACTTCCRNMKESGRILNCPLCRDNRFRMLVDYSVRSTQGIVE
jgi:hypothetical protein